MRLRLTEQESGPAFPCCDGKYNNTALCQTPKPGFPTPTGQHVLLFPVSIPIWWVSWPQDESPPLWLPYIHSQNAKGSYSEGWITSTFHPGPLSRPAFSPAVNQPASWCSSEGPSYLLPPLNHPYCSKFCSPAAAWPTQSNLKHSSALTIPLPFSLLLWCWHPARTLISLMIGNSVQRDDNQTLVTNHY